MKKLLLTSTSILAVAFASQAFAGGSSTNLVQTGNNQKATVTQSSTSTDNHVGTSGGPLQTDGAFLQQNGTDSQNPALAGTGGNVITINQTGNGNSVVGDSWYLVPSGPSGTVAGQSGTGNVATIQQAGFGGGVQLQQLGHYNGTTSGYGGSISQSASSNYSQAVVHQAGDRNDFTITQNGGSSNSGASHNRAQLTQGTRTNVGSYNLARINQTSGPNTAQRLTSDQLGKYNHLDSTQTGTGNANYLTSSQTGTGVNAGQANSITNLQTGSGEKANLTQIGYSLTITNNQSGVGDLFEVASQSGNNNSIANVQSGAHNDATVSQVGYNNKISNNQTGTNGLATYTQNGSSNAATLVNQVGLTNSVEVTQSGTHSGVTMLQYGGDALLGGNKMTVSQTVGNHNLAFLVQGGTVHGTGDATELSYGSYSSGNTINVTQNGLAGSGNNYAAVQQNSNGNTSTTTQTGSNNTTTVKQ
jgi:hypothetical protein